MICCREFASLLYAYVALELDDGHSRECEDHLQMCAPCQALLQSYRITITLGRQLPPQPIPPAFAQRLYSSLG